MKVLNNHLIIKSKDFRDGGLLPKKCTGFGEDVSPQFRIENIPKYTMSLAIIMDDLDAPLRNELNHWIIWNIRCTKEIPGGIPRGDVVPTLGNAIQGVGYGKNRYRGPKQPFFLRKEHRYRFRIYALDNFLTLKGNAKKDSLLKAMCGHVIRMGEITGKYKR